MKKVLITCGFPAPYRVAVFKELAKVYDLTIFFSSNSNENRNEQWFEKSGEVEFYITNNSKGKMKFRDAIKHINTYDFVLPYEPSDKISILTIFCCRLYKIPYYVNCDGAILRKNFIKDMLKRFLFSGATACFASGKSAINYFKCYGVKEGRIFVHKFTSLAAGDILENQLNRQEQVRLRNNLHIDDKITIISVGQFIYRKGFDVLLKAWKQIDGNCQLYIIGGGNEKQKYVEYIRKHNLTNVYILDFMEKDKLFNYYKASDLFVLPTREDIWGLVVNEALAHGLPVITTDNCVAGIELINEGSNGYLVPVNNENTLAERIQQLIDNPVLLKKMKIKSLESIKDYTIENIALSHIKAIEKTLPKRR